MKCAIIGKGRMGSMIKADLESRGHEVIAMADVTNKEDVLDHLDEIEMVLDFSHPDNLNWLLARLCEKRIPLVEGTTGLAENQKEAMKTAALLMPVFYSANYSLGIAVLKRLAAQAAEVLRDTWDIEITEKHHNQKADAPSGTALALLEAVDPEKNFETVYGREGRPGPRGHEIGMYAVRGGTMPGMHEVEFFGKDETLSLSHNAYSRQIFVTGAIEAAEFLKNQPAGLYDMEDLIASRV